MAARVAYELTDGRAFYSASGIGKCEKALYHSRMGVEPMEPPELMQRKFDEGNENEDRILKLLESEMVWQRVDNATLSNEGWQFGEMNVERGVDYSQQVRVEFTVGQQIVIGAHLDGIVELKFLPVGKRWEGRRGERRIVEVKAFGDSLWKQYLSKGLAGFPGYQWQVSQQMYGAKLPLLFVVGHKGSDGKVFELHHEEINEPPISRGLIAAKLLRIEKAVKNGDEPPCPQKLDYPCPYFHLHEGKREGGGWELDFGSVPVETKQPSSEEANQMAYVDALARDYKEIKQQQEILNTRLKGIQGSMLELLDKVEGKEVSGGEFNIINVVSNRSGGLDEAKMREEGIDVERFRKPGTTSRYPKITNKKH